ncbi:MAG: type II secretion system F family protein [Chloroflexi bacterium]|nr:type II secretion system F family protein [Chloroflexota bacterium]
MNPAVVIAILAALSIIVFFWGLARVMGAETQVIETRLDQFALRRSRTGAAAETGEKGPSPFISTMERGIASRGFTANTARELARADLKLTVSEYVLLNVIGLLAGGLLAYLVFRTVIFIPVGAFFGLLVPRLYVKFRQNKRLTAFNNQLGDTITLLANSLRSGYSLAQSMEMVAKEAPPPTSVEFHRVVQEIGLGLTSEEALANLVRRVPSEDLDLTVTAINVQHEVGGNLAQILETVGFTIRERVRIKGDIKVLTSQQRISGYVISLMPFGLGLALFALNRSYMSGLFADLCGWVMVTVAFILMVAGFLVMRKITDIEV